MRDINRIEPFCEQLAEQWKRVPDMRFGQFMSNILGVIGRDPFYIEDNSMLNEIKDIVDEWKGKAGQ